MIRGYSAPFQVTAKRRTTNSGFRGFSLSRPAGALEPFVHFSGKFFAMRTVPLIGRDIRNRRTLAPTKLCYIRVSGKRTPMKSSKLNTKISVATIFFGHHPCDISANGNCLQPLTGRRRTLKMFTNFMFFIKH